MNLLMSNKSNVKHHIVSSAAVTGVLGGSPTASAPLQFYGVVRDTWNVDNPVKEGGVGQGVDR